MEKINLSKHGGIYIILNVIDFRAYVGKAKNFNNRDHIYELENGMDTTLFQLDYDKDKEFVYMIGCYESCEKESMNINLYERMYMTLMEQFGFELYNEQCNNSEQARKNRQIDNLSIDETFYLEAKDEFDKDFIERFGISAVELSKSSVSRRIEALEYYAKKRLSNKFLGDRFLFNKKRIKSLFNNNSRSICSIDIDEMFISKAGNYLGEGLDQIVNYELESIRNNNYCLWTFANNAVSYEVVTKRCENRKQRNKDTYVLFEYTPSSVYASAEAKRFDCIKRENAKKLTDEELDFLSLVCGKDKCLFVPTDIDCTATYAQSASAFVIQDLFLLDEVLNSKMLNKYYKAIRKDGLKEISEGGAQRSTHCIKREGVDFKLEDILQKNVRRKFCFVGKLVAPYILKLNSKEL